MFNAALAEGEVMTERARPAISVLLCTVRDDQSAYVRHPNWGALSKVIDDLSKQTFDRAQFELVVVDGLWGRRHPPPAPFRVKHVPPRNSPWVARKAVAICAYRNTGLIHADGDLVVNLDDCCELPRNYLSTIWRAWDEFSVCAGPLWRDKGDTRPAGLAQPGQVFGFGSYPLEAALQLNGYDEAYDGSQGLEDSDWSTRLCRAGLQLGLCEIEGFRIHDQGPHSPIAIGSNPIVKCCNMAWTLQQVERQVQVANVAELWDGERLARLASSPCEKLQAGDCTFHNPRQPCAYRPLGWPGEGAEGVADFLRANPPVIDLRAERRRRNDEDPNGG